MPTTTKTVAHTPGPWAADKEDELGFQADVLVADNRRKRIAACGHDGRWMADGEAEANARLIAAAPDLLAALKAMVASYDGVRDILCKTVIDKLANADAAIAKAEGGAK